MYYHNRRFSARSQAVDCYHREIQPHLDFAMRCRCGVDAAFDHPSSRRNHNITPELRQIHQRLASSRPRLIRSTFATKVTRFGEQYSSTDAYQLPPPSRFLLKQCSQDRGIGHHDCKSKAAPYSASPSFSKFGQSVRCKESLWLWLFGPSTFRAAASY